MNLSEMTHRLTDTIKRITDRLTHGRDTHPQRPASKDNPFDNRMRKDRNDVS